MTGEIERFQDRGSLTSDIDLIRLLTAPLAPLPARITSENDPLGLVEHNRIHEEHAEQVFNGLAYACSVIAPHNPGVRAQLLEGADVIEFPEVQVGDYLRYGLRHRVDGDRRIFELYRADQGNKEGGFFAIKNSNGSVIVRRSDSEPQACGDQPEYDEVIVAALRGVLAYAVKSNIPMGSMETGVKTDHFEPSEIDEIIKQAKREQKLHYKLLRQAGRLASLAGNTVYAVFSKETEPGVRRLALGRLALAAALLPAPFIYSDHVYQPASFKAAGDGLAATFDYMNQPEPPDAEELYDAEQLDLPSSARLTTGSEQPITVLDRVDRIGDYAVIDMGEDQLHGTSPRRVQLREALRPNLCQQLSVEAAIQDNDYALATTNSRLARTLTVEATQGGIFVCNEGDEFISRSAAGLVFDSRPSSR